MTEKIKGETPKKDVPKEEPKEEEVKPEIKKESVTIPKDTFDRMLKDISMLKETADRRRMALYQHRHKEDQLPIVCLREINSKVVLGWRMTKNEMYFSTEKNRWVENQTVEVLYDGGETEEMSYRGFLNYTKIPCEKIGTIEEDGQVALKLRRKDNLQEYTVGVQFVN